MTDVEERKIDIAQTIISFKVLHSSLTGSDIGDNSLKDVIFKAMLTKEISNNLDNLDYRKKSFEKIENSLKDFNMVQFQKNKNIKKLFQIGLSLCLALTRYDDLIIKNKPLSEVLNIETNDLKKEILNDTSMYKKIDNLEYKELMNKFINKEPYTEEEKGLFIAKIEENNFIAIDNSFGDFYTQSFTNENSAINFLLYENAKINAIETDNFKVEIDENEDEEEDEL